MWEMSSISSSHSSQSLTLGTYIVAFKKCPVKPLPKPTLVPKSTKHLLFSQHQDNGIQFYADISKTKFLLKTGSAF